MAARDREARPAERLVAAGTTSNDEVAAGEREVAARSVGVVGLPDGDHPAGPGSRAPLGQRARAGIVDAADQEPAGSTAVGELVERRGVGLLGAPEVEVVGLDVGHDRGVRPVDEEGAVALVGLGDEQVAAPRVGVAPGRGEHAADGVRRVGAGSQQRRR